MSQVLVNRYRSALIWLGFQLFSRCILGRLIYGSFSLPLIHLLLLVHAIILPSSCAAQTVNGQTYTNGLAIINSPSPKSEQHVGSTMPISIELSGNGKLPLTALAPGSGLALSYELLEIYLISGQMGLNLTVSSGTGLLTGESGTVRHRNFVLPSCLPAGQYNLTFYETSFINSTPYFTITPVPISVSNGTEVRPSCKEGTNVLQALPQPSSDFGQSPFNSVQPVVTSTGTTMPGVAIPSRDAHTTSTGSSSLSQGITSSPTSTTLPEDSSSKSPGSVTLVIVSQVVTTIADGQGEVITTRYMTTRTTTVLVSTADSSGFIPINSGNARSGNLIPVLFPLLVMFSVVILTAIIQ